MTKTRILSETPGRRAIGETDRGCVEDQPQKAAPYRPRMEVLACRLALGLLRLVFGTAVVRFANDSSENTSSKEPFKKLLGKANKAGASRVPVRLAALSNQLAVLILQ